MINRLNIFNEATFVVADEWNANFRVLNQSNYDCAKATEDAEAAVATPESDMTAIFNRMRSQQNSFYIQGNNVVLFPECEYFKPLASGQDVNIVIPTGFNAEARVVLYIPDERQLLPFTISYNGNLIVNYGGFLKFRPGVYFVMIYEIAGTAMVKLLWTGE